MLCKAHSRRTGEPCKAHAMRGKEVCWTHGGASAGRPPNPLSPRSKYHPSRILAQYHAALADENLTSLREDIAYTERQVAEAILLADRAEGCPVCARACDLYEDARRAGNSPAGLAKANALLAEMHAALRSGREGQGLKAELRQVQEHKRRLTSTENRREADREGFIMAQQTQALIGAIAHLANECIRDTAERARFAAALLALGGAGGARRASGER